MEFEFRPLGLWPGEMTRTRERSRFRAGYKNTLDILDTELRHLRAKEIVLQIALSSGDIRLDGRPRCGSRPSHPGIILSFESKHGPLSYPCDRYDSWEDNLRAIALSLEALRTVDRYGVTRRAEQYRGWQQIENKSNGEMTKTQAMIFIRDKSGMKTIVTDEDWKSAYRAAALRLHPDRNPGDEEAAIKFKQLQQAKAVLGI